MLTVMKGIVRAYFLLFSPILLLVLAGGYLLGNALIERELYRVRSDESTVLALASGRLDDELAVPLRHVRSISEELSCSRRRVAMTVTPWQSSSPS